MSAEQRFRQALGRLDASGDAALLPSRVATAVKLALDVAGASFSLRAHGLRVPLGASDPSAALAERLQFTIGDGPCMNAIDAGIIIVMPEPLLWRRWPALAEAWAAQTPFRSVVSHPLPAGRGIGASLNLFLIAPNARLTVDPAGVTAVVAAASGVLFHNPSFPALDAGTGAARLQVWVAIGMVMNARHLTAFDALALLRAHAYAGNTTVDELAQMLVADPALIDDIRN